MVRHRVTREAPLAHVVPPRTSNTWLRLTLLGGIAINAAHAAPANAPAATQAATQAKTDEKIIVEAKRRNQMQVVEGGQLGALGTKKSLDVPFSIKSYTASLILNQQAETLGAVLANDPSIRTTYGYGNFAELFIVRGFPLYGDDISMDGLYGVTPRQLVSPELYEQVQVLNGANAFLNGAAPGGSSIGGGVNLVMKKAGDTPLTRITAGYTGNSIGGGGIDISRRFGTNHQFGFRLNVAGHGGVSSIDHEHRSATVVGGALDWHDSKTRITADMAYQDQDMRWGRPTVFLGTVTSVPRAPSPSHNFGQPWNYNNLHDLFGTLHIEHDLTKNIMLYGMFGARGGTENGNYSTLTVNNATTGAGTNGNLYVPRQDNNESVRGGIRIHLATGPVKHEFNIGGSGLWEDNRNAYAYAWPYPASNLYNTPRLAKPNQTLVGGNISNPKTIQGTNLSSVYFSDTLTAFDNRVALIAGFRWQGMLIRNYAYSGPLTQRYNQSAITPVVGLVLHPTHHTSLYFNRIEGLAQGPTASGVVVNLGQVFPPYRSVQYEVGAKYETQRFNATLAFYQISQPNAYTIPYGNSGSLIFTEDGQQRNRGMEININGEPLKGFRLIGGGTLIDADQRHTAGGLYNGKTAIGIANYTINANAEWDLPFLKGGTLTGRVINTGRQQINAANTLHLPTWTTFDLGARYTFLVERKPTTLRLGVENLANRRYWSSAYGGYLLEGMPRTFRFSVTMDL